jgi:hypothetical protein
MQYVNFTINDVGSLVIGLTQDGNTELERLLALHPEWEDEEIFLELLDDALTQGWYVVAPEQIRAQTKSLLLSDTVEYDSGGNITRIGRTYWFPNYAVQGYAQTLLQTGHIIFQQGSSGISTI